jgi:GNAT superfamily N-acetyltransferase
MEAVRMARSEDIDVCRRLWTDLSEDLISRRGGHLWLAQQGSMFDQVMAGAEFENLLADPRRLLLMGTLEGVIMGMAMARIEDLPDGTILGHCDGCFVEPGARGVGLGSLLLNTVVSWLGEHRCIGVDGVALPGDRGAKNFFEGSGFKARLLIMHRSFE